MTVFVTNLYKGGVPRSKSLQNDINNQKTEKPHHTFDTDDNIFGV